MQAAAMVVGGISGAITSLSASHLVHPSPGRPAEFADAAFSRVSGAVLQQRRSRAGAAGTLEMVQAGASLCLSTPSRRVYSSRVSADFAICRKDSCCIITARDSSSNGSNTIGAAGKSSLLQQCQQVGRLLRRRICSVRCYPSQAASASASAGSVSEEAVDAIDPGQPARVSKVYRPAVILPGLGNNSGDYDVLVKSLEALGVPCTVAKVARIDWLRNAAGFLDGAYWKGTLRPRPVLNWYLDKVKDAIETAKAGAGANQKLSLIGHSAGGWLARVYMADFGTEDIELLLTLGTPHLPPPRGTPGVFDQTRGLLYHIEENCPGAYHAPNVKYVCVAGRYVKGGGSLQETSTPVVTGAGTLNLEDVATVDNEIEGQLVDAVSENDSATAEKLVSEAVVAGSQSEAVTNSRPSFRDRIIGAGYKQVCGRADVWGDGVVPEESAYLDGAVNICLNGAYHSPVGADELERPWYGSAGKIDQWVHHLLDS